MLNKGFVIRTLAAICAFELIEGGGQLFSAFLEQLCVTGKGGGAGVRGTVLVGGVYGQYLPVARTHPCQMVYKASGGFTKGSCTPFARNGRHVAHYAPSVFERFLQALFIVEVHGTAAQGVQRDLGRCIVDTLRIAAADEIAALLANKGNTNRVSMLDAAVDQYRDAFTTGATAGVHQDVVVQGVCLDGVRGEQRHRSPQASGVFHHRQKVGVLVAPRIGGAVARVVQALNAGFVAVIDARHAGECHLHEDGEPEACLGKP